MYSKLFQKRKTWKLYVTHFNFTTKRFEMSELTNNKINIFLRNNYGISFYMQSFDASVLTISRNGKKKLTS